MNATAPTMMNRPVTAVRVEARKVYGLDRETSMAQADVSVPPAGSRPGSAEIESRVARPVGGLRSATAKTPSGAGTRVMWPAASLVGVPTRIATSAWATSSAIDWMTSDERNSRAASVTWLSGVTTVPPVAWLRRRPTTVSVEPVRLSRFRCSCTRK